MSQYDLVMWPAAVRLKPFADHVAAAAAGCFDSICVSWDVVQDVIAGGGSPAGMRRLAENAGIKLRHFDCLTDWSPLRFDPNDDPMSIKRFDISIDQALALFGELGTETVTVVGAYQPGEFPLEPLIAGFGSFCDRAAAQGLWVDIEFMPIYGVPSLQAAWNIVGGAGRANSGILVDVWHFAKCGGSLDLLREIPGRHLRSMQLSDGYLVQRGADAFEDTTFHRTWPLEGELPVRQLLRAMIEKGHLHHIGSEVFSHQANAMTAQEAGRRSAETMWPLLLEFPETLAAGEHLRDRIAVAQ